MEDHNQPINNPQYEDADHQQDMRLDPLTTRDSINRELADLESKKQTRELSAAKAAQEKAAAEAKEARERQIEEQVAQRIAARSQSDPADQMQ